MHTRVLCVLMITLLGLQITLSSKNGIAIAIVMNLIRDLGHEVHFGKRPIANKYREGKMKKHYKEQKRVQKRMTATPHSHLHLKLHLRCR